MTQPAPTEATSGKRPGLFQNWLSLLGFIVAAGSFFAVICLISIDFFSRFSNPYMGILTYFVAPIFLFIGILLVVAGIVLERRRLRQRKDMFAGLFPIIDLNRPLHRKVLGSFVGFASVFFLVTAILSYRSYHFTESVQFCGQTCHTVMKPEFTAYQNSPHARVTCVQCHIGPGATWFVRSKLSGSYQVYATMADNYPRPIPTPVKNLRPAQETCEQCHWPQKFYGSVERVNQHYMADETNTPWTVNLLMKVGGGDPSFGPIGGIHWHMNIANKVEYIATDEARQKVAWIRFTDTQGNVSIYRDSAQPLTPEQIAASPLRRMDCIDCHNRPTHIYNSPDRAISLAMSTGRIDPAIPLIKKQAIQVLTREYKTTDEALNAIEEQLNAYYQTQRVRFAQQHPESIKKAITEVQKIYSSNFFPEMKVNWRTYPNNIGHTIFPGCFRCHDGKHANEEGKPISHDCNACHTILTQGNGLKATQLSPQGLEFEHPTDIGDIWKEMNCFDCHNGALVQ
jgi:hypothetical protein